MQSFDEIENTIDKFHKDNSLFTLDLSNFVAKLLYFTEEYIKTRRNKYIDDLIVNQSFMNVLGNILDGVQQVICWGIELCPNSFGESCKATPSSSEKEQFSKLILLGLDYSNLSYEFPRVHKKLTYYEFINKNTIRFYYPDSIGIYEKLEKLYSIEDSRHETAVFANSYNKNDAYLSFNVMQSRRYWIDDHYELVASDFFIAIKPFLEQASAWWIRNNQIPEEWQFDKISVLDFKNYCVALFAYSLYTLSICYPDTPQYMKYVYPPVLKFSLEQIIDKIQKIIPTLSADKIICISNLLSYSASKNTEVHFCVTPIIQIGDFYYTTPHILARLNGADSLLYNLDHSNKFFSLNSNKKENEQISFMIKKFSCMNDVICLPKVTLPNPLPDIDLMIYSPKTSSVLLIELKWFSGVVTSGALCNKRNSDVAHAVKQMTDIYHYFDTDLTSKLNKILNSRIPDFNGKIINQIAHIIIVSGIPDSHSDLFPILSTKTALRLLNVAKNYEDFIFRIASGKYLEEAKSALMLSYKIVNYADYTFQLPIYVEKSKIGRNEACPCGSVNEFGRRKKYKACCQNK